MNTAVKTIYDSIGGEPTVTAIVDGIYDKILAESALTDFYTKVDKEEFKKVQKAFFMSVTQGNGDKNVLMFETTL